MYKLTIETESLDEIYATISTLKGKANVTLATESDETPTPKKERKKKETVQDDAPAGEKIIAGEIDYATVSKATLALVKAKGKPTVLKVLEEFGVKSAQGLKPEQWSDYIVSVDHAMLAPVERL